MHSYHHGLMSEILFQSEAAANIQASKQKSLNQIMRERLALTGSANALFQSFCEKGCVVISRDVRSGDIGTEKNIKCFEKAPTKISVVSDLEMHDIDYSIENKDRLLLLLKDLKLVDGLVNIARVNQITNTEGKNWNTTKNNLMVQFPLKEKNGDLKSSNARFYLKNYRIANFELNDFKTSTLLQGMDEENNAVFFRWTEVTTLPGSTENPQTITDTKVKECVVLFNRSNKLAISPIVIPIVTNVGWPNSNTVTGEELNLFPKLKTTIGIKYFPGTKSTEDGKTKGEMFKADTHDPTLYFLRKMFPAKRYTKSNGNSQHIINSQDVASNEAHIRKCTKDTVHLFWVYEALCSIGKSIGIGTKKDITVMPHEEILLSIALKANEITKKYNEIDFQPKGNLANLKSDYNSSIGEINYNTNAYLGYKLTQWLLESVEKCTFLIPKHDVYTPQRKTFRAQLTSVHCGVSRSAIKTTYTTDVLLEMVRKCFIDPWGLLYSQKTHDGLPEQLKTYSLKTICTEASWAEENTMLDKQISVQLKMKRMTRFTFHAFRHSFHGSDPMVVSKMLKDKASIIPTGKASKKKQFKNAANRNKALKNILKPKKVTWNQWLRHQNSGESAPINTLPQGWVPNGGPVTGPYSWPK